MQVLDRDELELPFDGPTIFHDIEGDEELFAEPWAFRRSYQKAMNEFLDERSQASAATAATTTCGSSPTSRSVARSASSCTPAKKPAGRHPPGHTILTMITFLSPLLIWGTLLGAIPIIIHLLNRRRFRRVEWAPMHYLKLTIQRNRRRIQLEQLLALAAADRPARAAVLLPGPAGARTRRGSSTGWAAAAGSSQVVLIDDSLSMGYAAGESTAFQRAKEAAAALAGRRSARRTAARS